MNDDGELDPRARARQRAMAESQAIAKRQSQERRKRELHSIAVIRKERIASSKAGLRRRLLAVAAATGIVCVAVGYAVGAKSPVPVQLHIVERSEPAPAADPSAGAALKANTAQPQPASILGSGQGTTAVQVAEQAALPAQRPASSLAAEQASSAPAALQAQLQTSPQTKPSTPAKAVPLPLPLPMPVNVHAVPAMQRAPAVQTRQTSMPLVERMAVMTGIKPAAKPPEDADFVLSSSRAKAAPEAKAAEPLQALSAGANFKVVNVIEGTVIVRQGQSVRQIKVGEKMPDGQTLKSVSVDKGQFETSP